MSDQLVVRQVRAIRDLAQNLLELLEEDGTISDGPCAHPKEQRLPAGVMGAPNQFFCRACQTMVNGSTAATVPTDGGA